MTKLVWDAETAPAGTFNPRYELLAVSYPEQVIARQDLSPAAKLLAVVLLKHSGDNGVAWPKVSTLAKEMGRGPRGVTRLLGELKAAGVITVVDRSAQCRPNLYYFQRVGTGCQNCQGVDEAPCQTVQETPCQIGQEPPVKSDGSPPSNTSGAPCTILHLQKVKGEKVTDEGTKEAADSLRSSAADDGPLTDGLPPLFTKEAVFGTSANGPAQEIAWCSTPEGASRLASSAALVEIAAKRAEDERLLKEAKKKNNAAAQAQLQEQRRKGTSLRNLRGKATPQWLKKALGRFEDKWNAEFSSKFPDTPLASKWGGKEVGQARELLVLYSEGEVLRAVEYLIRHWDYLKGNIFKTPIVLPTLGLLRATHNRFVPEAKTMLAALEIKAKYDKWFEDHASEGFVLPPQELEMAYDSVKGTLQALGLK